MEEEQSDPPEESPRPNPVGLDDSEWFAADKVFELLTGAISSAQIVLNRAEVLRIQTVLAGWDAMVLDEQSHNRAVHLGGVQERSFGIHLGALLKLSPRGAIAVLHRALTLRERLAKTWAAFGEAAFSWRSAAVVTDASIGLSGAALAAFDEQAAELAAELAPHQLEVRLERLRDRLDREGADERAKAATRARHVSATPEPDGQGSMTLRGPQTDIAAMYDVVHQAAVDAHGRDGETRSLGALMFDIAADLILHGAAQPPCDVSDPSVPAERLGDLRVPNRKAVQATLLVLTSAATATGIGDEAAELAGWGTLTAEQVRRIVAHTTHWTRVLVDPVDDAIIGIDSHERYIPTGLRKLLQARDRTCQGPGCNRPAHRCDCDHTERFEHGGRTGQHNLSCLCRPCHEAKDAGYMDVRRRPDGCMVWRTRWGGRIVTRPPMTVRERVDEEPAPF